jgi:hypothetical protein
MLYLLLAVSRPPGWSVMSVLQIVVALVALGVAVVGVSRAARRKSQEIEHEDVDA